MNKSLIRPYRSMLYMPGSNTRALSKAQNLNADSLIFDLEDAVEPDSKIMARTRVSDAVTQNDYGQRELLVRINALETTWGVDDILAMAKLPIAGLVLPKVEGTHQVIFALEQMKIYGCENFGLWLMSETPKGILNAGAIYSSSNQITGIIMGTSDLAVEMRVPATSDRKGLQYALSHCITAARCNDLTIIDGVHLDLSDLGEFEQQCQQGRELGFDGKSLIHPKQLDICNRIYAPTQQEAIQAKNIIHGWQIAQSEGHAVCVIDGKLIENLHIKEAERILALFKAVQ